MLSWRHQWKEKNQTKTAQHFAHASSLRDICKYYWPVYIDPDRLHNCSLSITCARYGLVGPFLSYQRTRRILVDHCKWGVETSRIFHLRGYSTMKRPRERSHAVETNLSSRNNVIFFIHRRGGGPLWCVTNRSLHSAAALHLMLLHKAIMIDAAVHLAFTVFASWAFK